MYLLEVPPLRLRQKEVFRELAIELFYQVRDIPYVLGLNGDPRGLLSEYKGNCTRKSLYLKWKLEGLGYKVDLANAVFDWRELPMPRGIVDLLGEPTQDHMFLFVVDGENEMMVDATWDAPLSMKGLTDRKSVV